MSLKPKDLLRISTTPDGSYVGEARGFMAPRSNGTGGGAASMARGLHGGASVCRRLMTDAYVLFVFAAGGFIVDLNFCFLLKISVFYTILSLCVHMS